MLEYLTEHLTRAECACKCKCGFDTMDIKTAELFEVVRELNGNEPIKPRSGARCKIHNIYSGGSTRSQHLIGRALDLPVSDPQEIYSKLCEMYPYKYGFIAYNDFIHIDTRAIPYRKNHNEVLSNE